MKKIRNDKANNYLLFCLFAGHGMISNNEQVILMNEFDKSANFYKFFNAEATLRKLAVQANNVYIVAMYACCR